MAVDMFLKIEGVPGESQDKTHKAEIDVLSWSWGGSQSGTGHSGGGSGAGKVSFQDLSITKYVDKASPTLMQFMANGKHISKAVLVVRKAGEHPLEYVKLTMEDVLVSSVSTGGSGGEDRITEHLSLNFSKLEYAYKEQNKDGSAGKETPIKWNIKTNAES
jgi:type VI secretion system secreted protein Hcp